MSSCNRCGKTLHGLLPGFRCPECKSIERERDEDREREEEREEHAASALSEMRSEIKRSREESSENIAAAAAYIANAKNNPGDYDCPACRYTTLKYLASRCPKCQADTPQGYWLPIIERERASAEAARKAKEEWERGEPARKAEWERGEPARVAAAKAAKNKAFVSGVAAIATMLYWSYLLPCLILKTQSIFTPNLAYDIGNSPAMFAPVANWLFVGLNVLMIPFSASHVGLEFIGYIFGWGLAGLVLLSFIK